MINRFFAVSKREIVSRIASPADRRQFGDTFVFIGNFAQFSVIDKVFMGS